MRSVAGYVLAPILGLALLAAGIVLVVAGVRGYNDRIEGLQRGREGETFEVELRDTGGYSVYYETDDDRSEDDPFYGDLPSAVTIVGPGGNEVGLNRYDSDVTYSSSGFEGEGIYTFSADEAGSYRVSSEPSGEPDGTIAVGRGIGTAFPGYLTAGIGLIALGPLLGAVLAVATLTRRSRARRRVAPTYPTPYG